MPVPEVMEKLYFDTVLRNRRRRRSTRLRHHLKLISFIV